MTSSSSQRRFRTSSATRSEFLRDVPTLAEFLPGYEFNYWDGIAPKSTPARLVNELNGAINAALADPKVKVDDFGLAATFSLGACRHDRT